MAKLKIGIAGVGVFGGYHAAKIAAAEEAVLGGLYAVDPSHVDPISQMYGVPACRSYDALIDACGAIILATPASTHFDLAKQALAAGRHVLVEKPLALTLDEAETLVTMAEAAGLVLQVGHQERLVVAASGLSTIRQMPSELHCVRTGPFAGSDRVGDVSVVWDLMIHDIDLVTQLLAGESEVVEVSACQALTAHADDVRAVVMFGEATRVVFHASRMSDTRDRTLQMMFSHGEISIDFNERKLKTSTHFQLDDDALSRLDDPLLEADRAFIAACLGRAPSPISGRSCLRAIAIAEAIHQELLQEALSSVR